MELITGLILSRSVIAVGPSEPSPLVCPRVVSLHRYDKGLTASVVRAEQPGVVASARWWSVRSWNELDAGRTGFAHLVEQWRLLGAEAVDCAASQGAVTRGVVEHNDRARLDEAEEHGALAADRRRQLVARAMDRTRHHGPALIDVARESVGRRNRKRSAPSWRRCALYSQGDRPRPYRRTTRGRTADIADRPSAHAYVATPRPARCHQERPVAAGPRVPERAFASVVRGAGGWWSAEVRVALACTVGAAREGARAALRPAVASAAAAAVRVHERHPRRAAAAPAARARGAPDQVAERGGVDARSGEVQRRGALTVDDLRAASRWLLRSKERGAALRDAKGAR